MIAPPMSQLRVPVRVRVLIALSLAACMADANSSTELLTLSNGDLVLAACVELMFGLALAFALQAMFASLSFAGRVIDVQAGFGLAMVIDPGSRQQAPLFGTIFMLVAGVIFFSSNGLSSLLRLLATLSRLFPPGLLVFNVGPQEIIEYFGTVMGLGLAAASAVILSLFLIDVSIAFLSRTLPQMNALMLGLQVKTVVTLVVASMSLGLIAPVTLRLLDSALRFVSSLE
ncbi:flagellar biosynthetic protein [Caballeronia pedi]|uniref:Flagellar biosynthetic protein n=1 Tax=Caballeronia pedi TaxID=1777141 RepID=A0A158C0B3_9BURK|nr:flagellar biosynthetic protein [Caballeronia pedi]